MSASSAVVLAALVLGAGWAVWDIQRTERETLVVYTTPALRDLLEKDLAPLFHEATGYRVSPVYVAAGQQYNRLRMSGESPEADLFLHASPLYLEKGAAAGFVEPFHLEDAAQLDAAFKSAAPSDPPVWEGAHTWHAFAWSPLVEVFPPDVEAPPDLATADSAFGFPHPVLSNNGIWAVLFLEEVDPAIGERLLGQTRVQPTNARANIGGIADGSFELTLGYEAVVRFYQEQDAKVAYAAPVVHGERVSTRVLFSAALIANADRHEAAEEFLRFLFTPDTQARLAKHHFRPVLPDAPQPEGVLALDDVRIIEQDWTRWHELEATLPRYEVKS